MAVTIRPKTPLKQSQQCQDTTDITDYSDISEQSEKFPQNFFFYQISMVSFPLLK
jgi:hypothetical protein